MDHPCSKTSVIRAKLCMLTVSNEGHGRFAFGPVEPVNYDDVPFLRIPAVHVQREWMVHVYPSLYPDFTANEKSKKAT